MNTELQPVLDAAQAGCGHIFFVDAAHFVFGTLLCCLWCVARVFLRAASGRQRYNVLGAWTPAKPEWPDQKNAKSCFFHLLLS